MDDYLNLYADRDYKRDCNYKLSYPAAIARSGLTSGSDASGAYLVTANSESAAYGFFSAVDLDKITVIKIRRSWYKVIFDN